jgi:hypothetical protein
MTASRACSQARQLTELYRALRVYVNCFQPSMKLQAKEREESRSAAHLRSGPNADATTPCVFDLVVPKAARTASDHRSGFPRYACLRSSNTYRKRVFRHAATSASEPAASPAPLQVSVQQCTEEKVPVDALPHTPPSLLKRERKKKYQKTGRPHDWRTRKDPFEGEWEQITSWVLAHPELTGVEIFHRLEQVSPGRYRPTQVRTLQRGLNRLRTRLLVTFEDQWGEEVVNGQERAPELRAQVVVGV